MSRRRQRAAQELRAALKRLERASERLASEAREEAMQRAARLMRSASQRMEAEAEPGNGDRERRSWRHAHPQSRQESPRGFYRDKNRALIVGVCAGLARLLDVEPWVVRLVAVTGLIFLPSVVFFGYWALFLFSVFRSRGDARAAATGADHWTAAEGSGQGAHSRGSLSQVSSRLDESAARLRRIEYHITSGKYDLQRELNEI